MDRARSLRNKELDSAAQAAARFNADAAPSAGSGQALKGRSSTPATLIFVGGADTNKEKAEAKVLASA